MYRNTYVIEVYILHMYYMYITYVSATHMIHLHFYTCIMPKNTTHVLQVEHKWSCTSKDFTS